MRATEIFVEQLLVGLLVLLIACLPFAHEILDWLNAHQSTTLGQIVQGTLAVAAAYLLGILFDRCADTLFEGLDSVHGDRFARDEHRQRDRVSNSEFFPKRDIRAVMTVSGSSALDSLRCARIRMRLSRALAAYLPGVTFGATLLLCRSRGTSPRACALGLTAVGVVYFTSTLIAALNEKGRGASSVPYVSGAVITAAAVAFALRAGGAAPMAAIACGVALTMLAYWTWWRISETLRRNLWNFWKVGTECGLIKFPDAYPGTPKPEPDDSAGGAGSP